MSAIWDRATEVIRGRASMLAAIAGLLVFLPTVAQAAVTAFGGRGMGAAGLISLVALVLIAVRLWGTLALVAASSDPSYDRDRSMALGARRLPAMIGVALLLGLAAFALLIPLFGLIGVAGVDWAAVARGRAPAMAGPPGGAMALAGLYSLAAFCVFIWIGARLFVLAPVIVNEARGVGSIARAFSLTRGLTLRIIGVLILFALVFFVATAAATMVLGLVGRLLLNANGAALLGQVGAAAVAAAYAVVSGAYTAQLYRALTGREAAETFA